MAAHIMVRSLAAIKVDFPRMNGHGRGSLIKQSQDPREKVYRYACQEC